MIVAPLPWTQIEALARAADFPADAVLHRDVTHAVVHEDGAITLRLEPDHTIRARNLILCGPTRARLRVLRRLVAAVKTYGRAHGWTGWTVRMRSNWSFYGPMTHALVGIDGRLTRVDETGNEFWTGDMT